MHVLTTQSYLNGSTENLPPSIADDVEKMILDSQSQTINRSKTQGVRQESIQWDIRRNSTSSVRNSLKGALDFKDQKSKYTSPPLSVASSVGIEEEKSETKSVGSNSSSGLAAHLQKRWSTDVPIKPFDKPSEWQTKAIS